MPNYFKKYKKYTRPIRRRARKRYVNTKGQFRVQKLAQDIMKLKSIVNAEKKQIVQATGTQTVGQLNGNADGIYILDITPTPVQGSQDSQRNGDSVKIVSAMARFQFRQQANTVSPIAVILEIWQVMGKTQSTSDVLNLYVPTPYLTGTSIRDYNSQYDQDYRQQYRLLCQRKIKVNMDAVSGGQQITNLNIPIKMPGYGHHVKYIENSSLVASGQLMLVIRCDNGNFNASTTSTVGNIPVSGVLTGLSLNHTQEWYFYDN